MVALLEVGCGNRQPENENSWVQYPTVLFVPMGGQAAVAIVVGVLFCQLRQPENPFFIQKPFVIQKTEFA